MSHIETAVTDIYLEGLVLNSEDMCIEGGIIMYARFLLEEFEFL